MVSSPVSYGIRNAACTVVVPEAKGPMIVMRVSETVAVLDEPSRAVAPLARGGRSMTIGPPVSARLGLAFRAVSCAPFGQGRVDLGQECLRCVGQTQHMLQSMQRRQIGRHYRQPGCQVLVGLDRIGVGHGHHHATGVLADEPVDRVDHVRLHLGERLAAGEAEAAGERLHRLPLRQLAELL
jgi:hypothetical protein